MKDLRALSEAIARDAGAVLAERFASLRTIDFKGGVSTNIVTDADRASEERVLGWLQREVPGHAVLAEESGAHEGSEYRWFVDPLDGITNYAHGVPHFCVSIAVADAQGVLAGAVFDPMRGELFSAARGQGATLDGRALVPSTVTRLERALLCTGFPYDVQQKPELPLGLFSRLIQKAQGMRRMGSAALDLAWVAAGRFDGFFEFGLQPWDVAAGGLLVLEAGGAVSRVDGAPFDPLNGDLFASAPGIAAELSGVCADFVRSLQWKPTRFGSPPSV